VVGGLFGPEDLLEAGERIWNLERLFNLREGFTKKDDTLPPRLLQAKEKFLFRSHSEKQLTLADDKEDNIFRC